MRIYISLTIITLSLFGCSTTKNLPEGEQLYTGISQITFGDEVVKESKRQQHDADSAGVITAIDDAVQTVGDLFSGTAAAEAFLPEPPAAPLLLYPPP